MKITGIQAQRRKLEIQLTFDCVYLEMLETDDFKTTIEKFMHSDGMSAMIQEQLEDSVNWGCAIQCDGVWWMYNPKTRCMTRLTCG